MRYPPPKCEDMSLYSLTSIATAICHKRIIIVCDKPRKSGLKLEDLLQFEPLAFCDIGQVYHPDEEEECLSESFLSSVAKSIGSFSHSSCFQYMLEALSSLTCSKEFQFKEVLCLLRRICVDKTHEDVRSCLNQYSIFRDRNPQVSS